MRDTICVLHRIEEQVILRQTKKKECVRVVQ